jgi:hypothetical protein
LSLNHDNNPRGAWLNVLISRKFTFRHGICLRGGNVLLAGIMTLAWLEDDLDHEKCGKTLDLRAGFYDNGISAVVGAVIAAPDKFTGRRVLDAII